jgi:hypothetical protein
MKYHVALLKASDTKVIVQMCREKDSLSPEVWHYEGCWTTSKAFFRRRKPEVLETINTQHGTSFTKVVVR